MPKIDLAAVKVYQGSPYSEQFKAPSATRTRRHLGDAGGLQDFGVNLITLPPGGWSSQRHWHSHEDEFVYVLEGELTLVEDQGETLLRAGDCAAFPKNTGNGYHLQNRSSRGCVPESGVTPSGRSDDVLGHRHDELERGWQVRAQGQEALLNRPGPSF